MIGPCGPHCLIVVVLYMNSLSIFVIHVFWFVSMETSHRVDYRKDQRLSIVCSDGRYSAMMQGYTSNGVLMRILCCTPSQITRQSKSCFEDLSCFKLAEVSFASTSP